MSVPCASFASSHKLRNNDTRRAGHTDMPHCEHKPQLGVAEGAGTKTAPKMKGDLTRLPTTEDHERGTKSPYVNRGRNTAHLTCG